MIQSKAPQQWMIVQHYTQMKNRHECHFQLLYPKKDQADALQEGDKQSHLAY